MKIYNTMKRMLCSVMSILMIFVLCPVTAGASTVNGVTFTALSGTAGVGSSENYPKLIDGRTSTKWCITEFEGASIIIEASEAIAVSGYSMTTGNDTEYVPGRNPKDWTLYGCNDYNSGTGTGTWTSIHAVEDDDLLPEENLAKVSYLFDKTGTAYKYFKLDITANHTEKEGSDCMQLSEFSLTDCDHSFTAGEAAEAVDDDEHDVYNVTKCSICGEIKSSEYARTAAHTYDNGICSACGAVEVKDMVESLTGAATVTLPASFDYELGSENALYKDNNSDNKKYAKFVKIDITAQDIGKMLSVEFAGKSRYVDTYLHLFKKNGETIQQLRTTDDLRLMYDVTEVGTYYIALAGYNKSDIGLCHADIELIAVKDMVESLSDAETVTLPSSFDYELGSEKTLYSYDGGSRRFAKIVKADITAQDAGKTIIVKFSGKSDYVNTYMYLFKQNGTEIEYLTRTDDEYLTYNIPTAGTYYIALAGYDSEETGLCHADIELVDSKDMVEGFKTIDTATTTPAIFDYKLGSEKVIYTSSYGNDAYAKLVKVDAASQDIGKTLLINIMATNTRTHLYLFKQNGTEIEYVTDTDDSYLEYDVAAAGTYYIAIAGYNVEETGLFYAEIRLLETKDMIESLEQIETDTSLPATFDYELGSEDIIYSSSYGSDAYAKLVKVDITAQDINRLLLVNFAGKKGYVDTYLYLFRQNGTEIGYVTTTNDSLLTYEITQAGTYYIALAGYDSEVTGLCQAEIKLVDEKDLIEGFKGIETATALSAAFDYELGSEGVIYTSSYGEDAYAKLVKVDITAQDINRILYVKFAGKNDYVDTYLYLFRQNGTEIGYVTTTDDSLLTYKITQAGTYYIALAGFNSDDIGLCQAEIKLVDAKDMVDSLPGAETVTIPASFDYELGSGDMYIDPYDYVCYAKLMKVDIAEAGKTLFVTFTGKNEPVNTFMYLFKKNGNDIEEIFATRGTQMIFEIDEAGTYYIALAGYDLYTTGLCDAEISLLDNQIYGTLDFDSETVPVPEEGDLWSWNAATATLTLKDGFVLMADEYDTDGIVLPDGATLIVEGKAVVIAGDDGIQYDDNLTIKGSGMDNSMLCIYSYSDGIYSGDYGELLIEDCGITISADDEGIDSDGNLIIRRCRLDIVSDDEGIYNSEEDTDVIIESSKIKIFAGEEGIQSFDGNITITDCDVYIDTASNEEGIHIDNSDTGNDYTLTITGGTLVIAALEEALEAPEIILTNVKFDIRTTNSECDLIYTDSYSEFSLPGFFCLYDIDGNELYRGGWTQELLDDDGVLCVDGVKVYRAKSLPDDAPFIKGDSGKMGWDVISDEINASDDGDTITVDMHGSTEIPKDILNDIKGKDIDLVLDMGNGFTWTINGKKVTEAKDVDLGVSTESNIPVQVINKLTGERSYTTVSLAYDGDFGFEAVLTVDMGVANSGAYANLYYYNENTGATEFISSGLIGDDGKTKLIFTHASEYVILIDSYAHSDITAGESHAGVKVLIVISVESLALFGCVTLSRKRRNKIA